MENCLSVVVLALGVVMAGTGDRGVFILLRALRCRIAAEVRVLMHTHTHIYIYYVYGGDYDKGFIINFVSKFIEY